tara:strand:+ start:1730 stop:3082 length:1353 start_codon:yes stop_codon:yes gene_type:complete
MGFNWGSFFASGVEELGEVAKAKDVSVAAEAKAQAEEFAEKQDVYEDEITKNKRLLRQEADAIRGLGIKDVGKIRTVLNTYGNADVMKKIQQDFTSYQAKSMRGYNDGRFKTLSEYIKSRITGAGTAMVSDESAEQVSDEASIIGNELDIQKAEEKAKAQGISLDEYLQNQAIKMSDRPAFNINARAARLVEESKMGLFGRTLTLEEAKQQILGARTQEGAGVRGEAKDLGDTGFALEREGGLSGEVIAKIMREQRELREETGEVYDSADLAAEENRIATLLSSKGLKTLVEKQGDKLILKDTDAAKEEALKIINEKLQPQPKGMPQLSLKSIAILKRLKAQIEGPKKKTMKDAIEELKKNPKLINDYIKQFGKDKVPPELQKLIPKDNNIIKIKEKDAKERVIDSEGNAPKRPPSSFLTKPSEKKARDEWDKLYGDDYYVNGKPKPKKV